MTEPPINITCESVPDSMVGDIKINSVTALLFTRYVNVEPTKFLCSYCGGYESNALGGVPEYSAIKFHLEKAMKDSSDLDFTVCPECVKKVLDTVLGQPKK